MRFRYLIKCGLDVANTFNYLPSMLICKVLKPGSMVMILQAGVPDK